jgi:hypothetical protein
MAEIAIDPTDIRPSSQPAEGVRRIFGRKTLLVASGITVAVVAIGGAAATLASRITLPSGLSGLAFLPKPEAPRRSEIRIGRLPDMPEIRDGVPAVVGTKPVRVIETAPPAPPTMSGPRPVTATVVPAAALPTTRLPTTFTAVLSAPNLPAPVQGLSQTRVESVGLSAETPAIRPELTHPRAAAMPQQPAEPNPAITERLEQATPKSDAAPKVEPVSTASVPAPVVPLPPPAPVRTLARAPEAKSDRPARPAAVLARQAPAQPVTPSPTEGAVPTPPEDDRVDILGVKLPNGRDLKNAVSSIGEALNLPKAF